MPIPITPEYRTETRKGSFTAHYLALLLLSLHWSCVIYINSSYLEQFASAHVISALYIVGALFTIFAFFYASHILTRFGNVRLIKAFTIIEFVTLIGMGVTASPVLALILFTIHQAIVPLILFNLDIIMEVLIGTDEKSTGKQRGILLTIMSLTYAFAPLAIGKILGDGTPDFTIAYIISAILLIPFLYVVLVYFKGFEDPHYPHLKLKEGIIGFWQHSDVRNVFCAHFLLQLFFTWMVIYTPLYLSSVIGLNWEQIGTVLFVGLMAYVLLEYAIGVIADRFLGEKEMMAFGFAITAIATSWFVFLDNSSIAMWMTAMFLTRVGASFVETTTESYFFKHTQGKDTNIIGLFRITRPLSYVAGAFLGASTLHFFDFHFLFVILGLLMIPGLFFAMALKDTK
jgi:MFS family permease